MNAEQNARLEKLFLIKLSKMFAFIATYKCYNFNVYAATSNQSESHLPIFMEFKSVYK